ncbi:VanZ family protein [bacterium]|nr:VanZ family protein [bacterium]MBT4597480.1 VanZ family protein [bacterium]MBT7993019.1 VanZ family protein [bacterium]
MFKFWLPVIIWMSVIFYFSHKSNLVIGFEGDREFLARKFAHICEFGLLAIFFIIFLVKGCSRKTPSVFLSAFLLTVGYAISDELHQTFIIGRSGNIKDVLVDSLGALLFLQVIAFGLFAKKRIALLFSILGNILAILLLLSVMMQEIIEKKAMINDTEKIYMEAEEKVEEALSKEDASDKLVSEKKKNISEDRAKSDPLEIAIPEKILLPVPFSSQAPKAVWDEVHEEACEEMSLIMVKYYFDKKNLPPSVAEEEIQRMKDYQLKRNGHYIDSDMKELAAMAKEYFKFKDVFVKYDITREDIFEALAKGSPVIVPTAGRLLGNPNFTGLGPLYHNLVIIGFEKDEFIVNDPGTRKGKHYRYKINILMNAIHDYTGSKKEIEKGRRAGIIFPMKK